MQPQVSSLQGPGKPQDIIAPVGRRESDSERLTEKLEQAMRDPDLNLALGGYVSNLIVPGLVGQRTLSGEQAARIERATQETLDVIAEGLPQPTAAVHTNAVGSVRSEKLSEFARW